MKTIKKTAEFGTGKNQKFFIETFENYKEFYETIKSREKTAHETIKEVFNEHSSSWLGVKSIEEAENYLFNGWDKYVDKINNMFNKNVELLGCRKVTRMYNNVCGFMPIIPNALMGLPKSMIDFKKDYKKSKILNFLIVIDRGCGNSPEEIIEKMTKQLAVIACLEKTGKYRCRIDVAFCGFSDEYRASKTYACCKLKVKSENQPFDIKRLCYPVVHSSMLRLMMFSWYESIPMNYRDYHIDGYGTSVEYWNSTCKKQLAEIVKDNNEKVIVFDFGTDAENLLKGGEL